MNEILKDTVSATGSITGIEVLNNIPTYSEIESIFKTLLQIAILFFYLLNQIRNARRKENQSKSED